MSTNFPNSVYVPTGIANDKDYVKISGYCYKKVASNVTVTNQKINTNIIGDFSDCLDCNTCACGKTIDFYVGGFVYHGASINFAEIKVPIRNNRSHFSDIYRKHTYKSIN